MPGKSEKTTPKESDKKTRITLDLTPKLYQALLALEEQIGAPSHSDVLREALLCFRQQLADNNRIQALLDEGWEFQAVRRCDGKPVEVKEILFLSLAHLRV